MTKKSIENSEKSNPAISDFDWNGEDLKRIRVEAGFSLSGMAEIIKKFNRKVSATTLCMAEKRKDVKLWQVYEYLNAVSLTGRHELQKSINKKILREKQLL